MSVKLLQQCFHACNFSNESSAPNTHMRLVMYLWFDACEEPSRNEAPSTGRWIIWLETWQ